MAETNQEKETELCKKERDEYLNGWKRAKADLVNYQKDEAKRFEEFVKLANAGLILELLPVLDSFFLAEAHNPGSLKEAAPIKSQLEEILRKNGLEKMAVSAGQPFDPACQESVGESESDQPTGVIAEVVGAGYLLNGVVLRPARVKISKGRNQ